MRFLQSGNLRADRPIRTLRRKLSAQLTKQYWRQSTRCRVDQHSDCPKIRWRDLRRDHANQLGACKSMDQAQPPMLPPEQAPARRSHCAQPRLSRRGIKGSYTRAFFNVPGAVNIDGDKGHGWSYTNELLVDDQNMTYHLNGMYSDLYIRENGQ